MQLILDIPMLADHRDEGRRRPDQARNIEAVVTGDRRVLVRHPNRFHDNDRLEARPFRSLWEDCKVCHGPDPPSHCAAVRVIEGIKEMLGGAPGQLMLDVLMKGLFDCDIRLFVIGFQGQEVVAALGAYLACDSRLAAHSIDGHKTAFDG